MILGRPTNLILGAFTAILGAIVVILANLAPPVVIPGAVVGAVGSAFGFIIALVANTSPVVPPGSTVTVRSPDSGTEDRKVNV